MLSFWEKKHWTSFDLVVIGGGIVGLSAALTWKERRPKDSVLVVERGSLPTGASTRNAGFACFGSLSELLIDIEKLGEDGAFHLVERRWSGLQKLRSRLSDQQLDLQINGGYELLRESELGVLEEKEKVNNLLKPLFRKEVYYSANNKIREFGFNTEIVRGMLYNPFEGQLDSGLMMKNLVKLARQQDIDIRTGTEVIKLDLINGEIEIVDSWRNNYVVRGEKVIVTTNAFAKELVPAISLTPGRGTVLITEEIPDLPFKGTFHYDQGYNYFRNYNNRIIFGGGRNVALEEENTTSFDVNQKILKHLHDQLKTVIIPLRDYKVEMHWSGIMAFGENKQPVVEKLSERVAIAVRLGGMGVAIGSLVGEEVADLLIKN